MAELKTQRTTQSAAAFLKTVEPKAKRDDSKALLELFKKVTGEKPVMWGASIVGFGMYHYKSERSAQQGDWPLVAFSPRKQNLTLYVMSGLKDKTMVMKLGKYKTSGGCLYINKLSDIDVKVLSAIIKASFQHAKKTLT